VLLVLTAPLILCAMLAVRLNRLGSGDLDPQGRFVPTAPIPVYKIAREARMQAQSCIPPPLLVYAWNPRVILRFGLLLRASHMNELPSFWNLVRGDMSLIGPRPERPSLSHA